MTSPSPAPSTCPLAVVAVGGNSLISDEHHTSIPDQARAVRETAGDIASMIAAGWRVVVAHGNGPQVGYILRRSELALGEVPPVPMDYATADTQGAIGYMFQTGLGDQLRRRGLKPRVATVVTRVVVDADDPAFADPTKPIGSFMTAEVAAQRAAELGWQVREDAGRGWRRVVASPEPRKVLERDAIGALLDAGFVVVAAGGGGIPVVRNGDVLTGVEAVVDKDATAALMALQLAADVFVISTAVERVAINFNRPDQQWLEQVTVDELRAHHAGGHFAAGSMEPKARAVIRFIDGGGRRAVVTDPAHLGAALQGQAGTQILPASAPAEVG